MDTHNDEWLLPYMVRFMYMVRPKKKTPNDYPLFGYKVIPGEKEQLSELLNEVWEFKNRKLKPGQVN